MAVDAGTIYSEVRIALDKLQGDVRQVQQTMNKLGPISKQSSNTVAQNWTNGFNQIKLVSAAAFAAVGIAMKAAVEAFAGFEQSIANVQSVARATPDELEKITEAAKEMGETTRFTASQAADAMYYLASAGFDASQSVAALDGVLALAGATQSDLAFTSAAVAASISQFNLQAEDSTRVANVFTASIQNSQATMEKLATSMASVGPVASGLGYTLEETSGILQILYNNGIDASTAGTALRRALADLANSASPAIAKLNQLGLSFDDVNPETNSFADILDRLNEASVGAGDALTIFGTRAGPSMIKLIEAGGDAVRDYTDAVTGTNAAAEAYAVQNDTLAGSFDRLKSATEAARISFIEKIEPALRGLVDVATRIVSAVSRIPGPIQVFLTILAAGIPTLLAAGSAIAFISTTLAASGVALGAILGPISLVVAGIAGLTAGIVAITNKVRESREQWEEYNSLLHDTADAVRDLSYEEQRARRADLVARQNELNRQALPILREITNLRQEMAQAERENAAAVARGVITQEDANRSQEEYQRLLRTAQGELQGFTDELELVGKAIDEIDRTMEEASSATRGMADDQDDLQAELTETGDAAKESGDRIGELTDKYRQWEVLRRERSRNDERESKIVRFLAGQRVEDIAQEIADQAYLQALRRRVNDERIAGMERVEAEERRSVGRTTENIAAAMRFIRQQNAETNDEIVTATGETSDAVERSYEAQAAFVREIYEERQRLATETALKEAEESERAAQIVMQNLLDFYQDFARTLIGIVDTITERRLAALDRELQATLEANGLAEESAVERYQRELEEAIATGDAVAEAEAEKNLKRAQIEEQFQRQRAELEYRAALNTWRLTLAGAIAAGGQAIINGFATKPFVPAGIAAGVLATLLTGAQIADVALQKPKPPSLATGGVVLPRDGGVTTIQAENGYGEVSLNSGPEGQELINRVARAIAEQGGGANTFILEIDSLRLAQAVAGRVNNGQVRMKL